jgi:hypothetical protein
MAEQGRLVNRARKAARRPNASSWQLQVRFLPRLSCLEAEGGAMAEKDIFTLKSFVGKHLLTGVEFGSVKDRNAWGSMGDCNVMYFVLDGDTYMAQEDPDDGYRSTLWKIVRCKDSSDVKNKFESCEVIGIMGKGDEKDILFLIDTTTGKEVLSVGTDSADDYYPCCVMHFDPTAMKVNQEK